MRAICVVFVFSLAYFTERRIISGRYRAVSSDLPSSSPASSLLSLWWPFVLFLYLSRRCTGRTRISVHVAVLYFAVARLRALRTFILVCVILPFRTVKFPFPFLLGMRACDLPQLTVQYYSTLHL
eukprot:IDg19074t1